MNRHKLATIINPCRVGRTTIEPFAKLQPKINAAEATVNHYRFLEFTFLPAPTLIRPPCLFRSPVRIPGR